MPTDNLQSTAPAYKGIAITKSDATVFTPTRGLYVGTAGDVTLQMSGDSDGAYTVLKNLAAGVIHPISCTQVRAASTAADIVGMY